ncbi:PTS sugar transporter subunit IIC [Amedibacillus sp. YH-ame6]
MKKLIALVENKIAPIASKLARQRHLKALQNSFLTAVPFMTIGSFALLICSPVSDFTTMEAGVLRMFMEGWAKLATFLSPVLLPIYNITLGMIAIYVAIGIGFFLSRHYKMNTLLPTFVTVASFLIICCQGEGFTVNTQYFGSSGMFSAIVICILAFEIYRFLVVRKIGFINMGSVGVPEAIADGIGNLFPSLIVMVIVGSLSTVCVFLTGVGIPELVGLLLAPVSGIIDTPFGFILLEMLVCLCWWFGIHDGFITGPIDTFLMANFTVNAAAFAAGTAVADLPYIVTEPFWWSIMLVGGSSNMLGLAFLCIRSKSKQIKTIGKVGIVPAIFNIGEPLVFGLPICYNPVLFIPYLIISPLCGGVFYFATKMGFLNKSFVLPGWNMPTPISQFLATMDVRALILAIIMLFISTLIWVPFFKTYEKQKLEEENAMDTIKSNADKGE